MQRSTLFLVGLGLLTLLVGLLILTRPLMDSLIIAGLLAYLLAPMVRYFERRHRLSRPVAAGLTYFLVALLIILLVTIFGATLWNQLPRLGRELREALAQMESWLQQPWFVFGF